MTGVVHGDPYNPSYFPDPYSVFRRLREEAPVYYSEERGEFPASLFIFHDPPRHTVFRSLVQRRVTPKRMAALEPSRQHRAAARWLGQS